MTRMTVIGWVAAGGVDREHLVEVSDAARRTATGHFRKRSSGYGLSRAVPRNGLRQRENAGLSRRSGCRRGRGDAGVAAFPDRAVGVGQRLDGNVDVEAHRVAGTTVILLLLGWLRTGCRRS